MNEWDTYVMCAINFNWTPQEVDSLDPDFMGSLLARLEAEGRVRNKPKGGGMVSADA